MTASVDFSPTNGVSVLENAEQMRSTTALPKHAAALLGLEESTEHVRSVPPALRQPTMEGHLARPVESTKCWLLENAPANKDLPSTVLMFALLVPRSPMDSWSMASALFARVVLSTTARPVPVQREKPSKARAASASVKMMSFWTQMETAIPVDSIRSFPTVNASAELVTP